MSELYTPTTMREKLESAGKTMVACHVRGVWPAGSRGYWPDIVREACESYNYNAPDRVRYTPDLHQLSELEKVEGWTTDLASYCMKNRKPWIARTVVYYMLVCPYRDKKIWTLRELGRQKLSGASHEAVRGWYADGVSIITAQRNERLRHGRTVEVKAAS